MAANSAPPHAASTAKIASEKAISSRLDANSSRYPNPLRPATISATTTPITDRVTEIFRPAKMDPKADGNSTLVNNCHRPHTRDAA